MRTRIKMILIAAMATALFCPGLGAQNVQLQYSTYLGGSDADYGEDIVVGTDGTAWITGYTYSFDFPRRNSYNPSLSGSSDAFVTGLSSTGSTLIYSTYLGGSGDEQSHGITIDSLGYIFVAGWTNSADFPTQQCFQASYGGGSGDGFITQFKPGGSLIHSSSYLGGIGNDAVNSIAVDSSYYFYVTGVTDSTDFPIVNPAFQSSFGGVKDSFFVKVHTNGLSLIKATYLGGSYEDQGYDIALDGAGYSYITGITYSPDFPTQGAYQSSLAGGASDADAFVTQFRKDGSTLYYSTYLGGTAEDMGSSIFVDGAALAYVTGSTGSDDFPVVNPYQSTRSGGGSYGEVFASKLNITGTSLLYSTYLGGSGFDQGKGITADSDGSAYLTGSTASSDFPILHPYQSTRAGGSDAFVSRLSTSGSALRYSTYLGGTATDEGTAVALDTAGDIYVTGQTASTTGFPVLHAYQSSLAGGSDAFVTKLSPSLSEKHYHYDYNGDGTSDIAIFRGSSGLWAVRGVTRVYFGGTDDQPAPGDYNGDGTTEIGIFRHTSGLWAVRGVTRAYFGTNYDLSVSGDYNGDGTWDIAIFRRTAGLWAVRGITRAYFGGASDDPSPGYFNSDNSLDFAIFRPNSGLWAARGVTRFYFGGSSDIPTAGDYNGDGLWEGGIFRPSSGLWAIRGVTRKYFGSGYTDIPVPADYNGNGRDDIGIFRYSSGLWAVSGLTRVYYGTSSDSPVAR